jgi:small subunit ribosomal protein S3
MGQKIHPTGFRVGVKFRNGRAEDWSSRWFAPKTIYGELLIEDQKLRRYIKRKLPNAGIADINIERTSEEVRVIIASARPGMIIGPKGAEVDKLKNELEDLINRQVKVDITEIRDPDVDAQLVAERIADMLKKRASFRRTMKQAADTAMQHGARGVKIMCSGRLGGHEMARREAISQGSVPLQKLSAWVDYGFAEAYTTYGAIGVKVWVYRGDYINDGGNANAPDAKKNQVPQAAPRQGQGERLPR